MLTLHDKDLRMIRPIDDVVKWGYHEKLNELTTGSMTLPVGDPITSRIDVPGSFVRAWDGERDLGYFCVSGISDDRHAPRGTITYQLQGAEATLARRLMDGWHEIGGTEYPTRRVIDYILGQQRVRRWALGDCAYTDYYQYNFQDTTLLESLLSLGEVLLDDYIFVFDSTATPWTLHLRRAPQSANRALVYRRGMTGLSRSVDGRIITRLYGRGYGEGDNQLTIASVNGGKPYLQADAATLARYGDEWDGVHVDTRQTDPATLRAHMARILEAGKRPTASYEATAIDLARLTGEPWDDIRIGDRVVVLDELLGEPVTVRCTGRAKDDVEGDPGGLQLTLDNSRADTAEELSEIRDKIGVHELYSQGATNMYSMQLSDNADNAHPLTMRFYVPGNVLRINSCLITWQTERFRTYATLAKSGGGSTRTSQTGGGATVTIPQMTTSLGVKYSSQPMDVEGSYVGLTGTPKDFLGAVITGTGRAGAHVHNMEHTHITPSHTHPGGAHRHGMSHAHATPTHKHGFEGTKVTYNMGHTHKLGSSTSETGGIESGIKSLSVTPDGKVGYSGVLWTGSPYDAVEGNVKVTTDEASATTGSSGILWNSVPYTAIEGSAKPATGESGAHTHDITHVHDMPHVHNIAHEHVIPAMSFTLEPHSHTVSVPEHTHELEYGVYEGARAGSLAISVDGERVPDSAMGDARELDVARYLRKNDDGRVTRGTWHEIEFVPDGLTRITADLFFQVFIQSRGAGDY